MGNQTLHIEVKMANSKRKCPYCKESKKAETMYISGLQAFCNREHYIEYQVANRNKLAKKGRKINSKAATAKHKADKDRIKTNAQWKSEAQTWFNKFIRLRDQWEGCPSCDRTIKEIQSNDKWKTGGAWDCGHFLTRGAFPELRFHEDNAHKQCKSCNAGSGKFSNKALTVGKAYRISLIEKIGLAKVEWLEGPHEPAKYTIDDLKEIIATYKGKCKELT